MRYGEIKRGTQADIQIILCKQRHVHKYYICKTFHLNLKEEKRKRKKKEPQKINGFEWKEAFHLTEVFCTMDIMQPLNKWGLLHDSPGRTRSWLNSGWVWAGPALGSTPAGYGLVLLHLLSGPGFNPKFHAIIAVNMSSACYTSRQKL